MWSDVDHICRGLSVRDGGGFSKMSRMNVGKDIARNEPRNAVNSVLSHQRKIENESMVCAYNHES